MRLTTAFILSSVFFVSCHSNKDEKNNISSKKNTPQAVTGYIVRTGSLSESLRLPAHLLPEETTDIHPEGSGIIQRLYFQEGENVKEGDLLLKLNDDELQAQLKKLNVQLQLAIKTEERSKELLSINGISRQEYDISYLQVQTLNADIELLKAQIRKTEVRAPFTGKIGFRNVSPGAFINPSTSISTIRKIQSLKLEFSVPDKYAGVVKPGDVFSFQVQGSNSVFSAKVYATESFVNDQTRGMNLRCHVIGKDPVLVAGAFASVLFSINNREQSLFIPSQAIIPQARGKKVILYKAGFAKMTDVKTGLRDSSRIEIISGLSDGDTILLTGLMSVKQDNPVTLTKVD